jgi:hypothetical protein
MFYLSVPHQYELCFFIIFSHQNELCFISHGGTQAETVLHNLLNMLKGLYFSFHRTNNTYKVNFTP